MGNTQNPKNNAEGYNDPTAYNGLKNAIHDETETEIRATKLIKTRKYIIGLAGFELVERIKIRDTKTGKKFL